MSPTTTVNTANTNVLTSVNPCATTNFARYTACRGTGNANRCFHCRSECSMPLSNAVSSVISSGIINTAQICNELLGCVRQRLKSAGNFFVFQSTKHSQQRHEARHHKDDAKSDRALQLQQLRM